jgi:hypothetical protein
MSFVISHQYGVVIWGTASEGKETIHVSNIDDDVKYININLIDVRNYFSFTEVDTIFYSWEIKNNCKIYSVYKTIHDPTSRIGYIAISLLINEENEISNAYTTLKTLLYNFSSIYIDKSHKIIRAAVDFSKIAPDLDNLLKIGEDKNLRPQLSNAIMYEFFNPSDNIDVFYKKINLAVCKCVFGLPSDDKIIIKEKSTQQFGKFLAPELKKNNIFEKLPRDKQLERKGVVAFIAGAATVLLFIFLYNFLGSRAGDRATFLPTTATAPVMSPAEPVALPGGSVAHPPVEGNNDKKEAKNGKKTGLQSPERKSHEGHRAAFIDKDNNIIPSVIDTIDEGTFKQQYQDFISNTKKEARILEQLQNYKDSCKSSELKQHLDGIIRATH